MEKKSLPFSREYANNGRSSGVFLRFQLKLHEFSYIKCPDLKYETINGRGCRNKKL